MTYSRSREEIEAAAYSQLRFLSASAQLFDQGATDEACRMANATHLLVGRGQRTHKSICDSLGSQDTRQYRSSFEAARKGLALVYCRLTAVAENEWHVELVTTGRGEVLRGRDLPFDDWWSEIVINTQGHELSQRAELSRRDVVMILRDKGGGAHFDVTVNDPLTAAAFRGELSFRYTPVQGEASVPVPLLLENCMRHIADELDLSFRAPSSREKYAAEHFEAVENLRLEQAKRDAES